MTDNTNLDAERRVVRRRALGNLTLILLEEAHRTAGRLGVRPFAPDVLLLEFREVRTLIRRGPVFQLETRDFAVILGCPPLWPFDREEALVPYVIAPGDFRSPNSDGHSFCLDLQGIVPERIPGLLYDNLRLRRFRLDHCVDLDAADFVRSHLERFPADPRPLYPGEEKT